MYIVCLHNDSFRGLLALTPPLLRLESFIYRKKKAKNHFDDVNEIWNYI